MVLIENPYCLGLFAGLVGALVMSISMIFARGFKATKFNFAERLGNVFFGHVVKKKYYRPIGAALHLAIGAGWGLAYMVFTSQLHIGKNVLSGLIFSLIPWIVMMLVFLPMIGIGVFGKNFNPKIRDSMLVFHLVFGLVIGIIAGL